MPVSDVRHQHRSYTSGQELTGIWWVWPVDQSLTVGGWVVGMASGTAGGSVGQWNFQFDSPLVMQPLLCTPT